MRSLGVLVLLTALVTAGCDGSSKPAAKPGDQAPPTKPTAAAPVLTVSEQGSGVECLERIGTVEIGYWENTLTASAPLRITSVETIGRGARVVGGLLVPVVGGAVHSTGVSDWPPVADRVLRKDVDWPHRARLVGGQVPVQRAMLPMLHVRAVGGGRLDAVVFHFRGDDGQSGTTRLDLGFRFSRTSC